MNKKQNHVIHYFENQMKYKYCIMEMKNIYWKKKNNLILLVQLDEH